MASKIENAAQDETEIDPLWYKAVDPDFTGQKFLAKLVANVIRQARKDTSRFSSWRKVCQRIFLDMELEKEIFNFVIEDLRCEFRNVADLFGCDVSEIKNEFARLFAEVEAAELKAAELKAAELKVEAPKPLPPVWEDYTADTTRSILKSQNYRRKNARIHFRRSQILDDLVYKEVNLAIKIWNRPVGFFVTDRNVVIDRILKNLKSDGFFIEDLEEWHYRKVAKFYRCQRSLVREEFLRQKDELVIKKEDEHILDLLVPNVFKLMDKSSYQSNEEILRLFCLNLEVYGQNITDLKQRDWTQLNKYWDKTEIVEEFHRMTAEFKGIKKESRPSQTPRSDPEFLGQENQENHEQGPPAAKRSKLVLEPEIEEAEDEDPEPEEEYQMGYYEDQMEYEEEDHDPELPGPNRWEYVDGIPAPIDENPAFSDDAEQNLQEMELEEEYEEAPEHQDPNGSSWEYGDAIRYAVDKDPVHGEADPQKIEVQREEQQISRVEQEDELQDIRDTYIDSICRHAEKNFNDRTSVEFKTKTSLRWVFNMLADQGYPLELTEGQVDKVATSFNCGRDDIESVFSFYKTEKEFLDNLDEGRPEVQRITDLINEVSTEMKHLSGDLGYQKKFLKTFYRKAVENKIGLVLNSRQKRQLATHLGITVIVIMNQLKKYRDLPKKVPAPKKKIHNNSQTVQPEKQLNPVSVGIAREEAFWGSLAELEPAETVADREAAVKLVEKERNQNAPSWDDADEALEEVDEDEVHGGADPQKIEVVQEEQQSARVEQEDAAVELVEKEKKKRLEELTKSQLTRTETYLEKYQKQIALPYQPKYTNVLSKVVEQFGRANNHATKWMPPPVLEAYRTAFLTILYEEINRELNEGEAEEIACFLKMRKKEVDYLRRKEKQFFETGRIKIDKQE